MITLFFFSSRRRHTRLQGDWSSDVCSSDLGPLFRVPIVASAGHPLSATALGAAEGAFQHVVKSFKTRLGTYTGAKIADLQAVQIKIAEARCLIDSGIALMSGSAVAFQ